MKYTHLLFLLTLYTLQACTSLEEPIPSNHDFGDCLVLAILDPHPTLDPNPSRDCLSPLIDTARSCERIVTNEVFKLSAGDKRWLPFYCCKSFSPIFYENENGGESFIRIMNKTYSLTTKNSFHLKNCPTDTFKYSSYCLTNEFASIEVFFSDMNKNLVITLSIEIDSNSVLTDSIKAGTSIKITHENFPVESSEGFPDPDIDVGIVPHLYAIVDQANLPINNSPNIKFHKEIELLGKTYFDVYTYDNSVNEDFIKMYYNRDFGIISYIDYDGTQWRLRE